MQVDIFDFDLDRDLIACQPANPRDTSRLLDLSVTGEITDRHFFDLPDTLQKGDVLVFNDTKVIPARLYGTRSDAKVEVTLYRPVDGIEWWAFIKNAKRLHTGDTITFYTNDISPEQSYFSAEVLEKKEDDGVKIRFACPAEQLASNLQKYGLMPLPPYIKRDRPNTEDGWDKYNDKENYQTIYAHYEGAVAAPTAGLHFTDRVFKALEEKGIEKVFVTLHVGAGTFLPVKTDDTKDHKMHAEYGEILPSACAIINKAKQEGRRIIAVGTTSLRLLETVADEQGVLHPYKEATNIFITPGYKFKAIDMLITNFHLPKSTLFMLVCAIAGVDEMQKAYKHATDNKYRFYSYGDSSLIKVKDLNKI